MTLMTDRQLSMTPDQREAVDTYYAARDGDGSYERQWGYGNPVAAAYWRMRDELITEAMSKYVNIERPLNVLEVGAGHGHELAKFARFGIPETRLAGIDLVHHRLGTARRTYPGIQFSQQDATAVAFADNSFDIVCQFTCVMHAGAETTQAEMCREMMRVVRPGGIILWWDQAPVTKRVKASRRIARKVQKALSLFSRPQPAEIAKNIAMAASEAKPARVSADILPVSRDSLARLFSGMKLHIRYAGLDYEIWQLLWPRSKGLAEWLWRTGWLSQHCFAVMEKPA